MSELTKRQMQRLSILYFSKQVFFLTLIQGWFECFPTYGLSLSFMKVRDP